MGKLARVSGKMDRWAYGYRRGTGRDRGLLIACFMINRGSGLAVVGWRVAASRLGRPKWTWVRPFSGHSHGHIVDKMRGEDGGFLRGGFASIDRAFTSTEVTMFAKLSGDFNPIHLDEEYAKTTRFGGRIVHGMLYSSLFSTLLATTVPGSVYISQKLTFLAPVFVGTEVRAVVTVDDMSPVKLMCETVCESLDGSQRFVEGNAVLMLPREHRV